MEQTEGVPMAMASDANVSERRLPPLGPGLSVLIPGVAAVLLWSAGYELIPWLRDRFDLEPALAWFSPAASSSSYRWP